MLTLGDVLAIVASLAGICVSAWALTMAVTTLFWDRTNRAKDAVATRPWPAFWTGILTVLVGGTISVIFLNLPNPLMKGVGWLMLMAILSLAAIGAGGIAGVAGERLRHLDPSLTPYQATVRGVAFVIVAGIFPILGWFLVAPLLLIVGAGAGLTAMRARRPVAFEVTP